MTVLLWPGRWPHLGALAAAEVEEVRVSWRGRGREGYPRMVAALAMGEIGVVIAEVKGIGKEICRKA